MAHIGSFYRDRGLSRAFLEVDFSCWGVGSFPHPVTVLQAGLIKGLIPITPCGNSYCKGE